jgi:hypothetical protein
MPGKTTKYFVDKYERVRILCKANTKNLLKDFLIFKPFIVRRMKNEKYYKINNSFSGFSYAYGMRHRAH